MKSDLKISKNGCGVMVDNRAHSHGVGNRAILKKIVNYDASKLKSD